MPWIPKYIISGGMYGGANVPSGSLTGFINDFCTNKTAYASDKSALGSKSTSTGGAGWDGAYGASDSLMREYALNHADGQFHEVDLFEIVVENPEGAQFYKQSIVISGQIRCTEPREYTRTVENVEHHCTAYSISFQIAKIRSRNYATPYSDPTSQNIVTGINRGVGGWTYVIGDEEALPVNYNGVYDGVRIALGNFTFNNIEYFGCALYGEGHNRRSTGNEDVTDGGIGGVQISKLIQVFGLFEPEEKDDPNEEEPPEDGPGKGGGGGGNGDHTLPNEPVPIPSLPEIGVASVNWLTVYKMTLTQINSFGQAMLDPRGWDALKQFFNNPLEAIVNIMLIPASATTAGSRTPVVGRGEVAYSWPEAYPIIHEEFAEIDCGVIMVKPYWDSAFDFDPYTRIEIFIPFIGFKQIKADDVMGSRVHVKYHVNVMTGEFTVFVSRTAAADDIYGIMAEQVIGEYNGNMGMRVPIGRNSSDAAIDASMRLMSNALGITAGAALGAALGDPMNVSASQAGSQIASATMTAVTGPKNHIERSGALGGGSGYLGNMKPFIVRSIPRQFMPKNYRMLEGYPANIGGTLSHYTGTGYQAVESIQLDGLNAYDSEINEIITILRGGVLV